MPIPTDPNTLVAGTPALAADVEAKVDAIFAYLAGNVDKDAIDSAAGILATQLDAVLLEKIGVNGPGSQVRRGKAGPIAAAESRSSTSYGLLTTPDRVSNLVLPTDGLIFCLYQAAWNEAVAGQARAALFLGANQVKAADDGGTAPVAGGPKAGEALLNVAGLPIKPLYTSPQGLTTATGVTSYTGGDVTTGQIVGSNAVDVSAARPTQPGICCIFAVGGTYTLAVQFKTIDGSAVTVRNRRLWAWTMGF